MENEAVIESVTHEEQLKSLEPKELVQASKFMVETVQTLGEDVATKLVIEVAKVDSAAGDLISAASANLGTAGSSANLAKSPPAASSKDTAADLQDPTTSEKSSCC